MGIRGLSAFLRPYAHSSNFAADSVSSTCSNGDQQSPRTAIVDGPALAYFAYGKALAFRGTSRNALDAAPSYQEVGEIALAWLALLERHGFIIEAVYFDGDLPVEKRATRIARLEASLHQLRSFRTSHNMGILVGSSRPSLGDIDFTAGVSASSKLQALPPPPFMVPAVIEALQASEFSPTTSVVAAEADVFCARDAALKCTWVFTSDSDLLVHEMHPTSTVVLFHDVRLVAGEDDEPSVLNVPHFIPKRISEGLGLENMLQLAFAVHSNPHKSFPECLKIAKREQQNDDFASFKQSYTQSFELNNHTSALGNISEDIFRALCRIDPRLSEVISQRIQGSRLPSTTEYEIFLPFLIDDPSRASAWQSGRDIRCMAYKLLDGAFAPRDTRGSVPIQEYERRGSRISRTCCPLMTNAELQQGSERLIDSLAQWINPDNESSASVTTLWRTSALYFVLQQFLDDGKPLPSNPEMLNLICGLDTGTSWTYLQFAAHTQAFLYSLRMLYQVLSFLKLCKSHFEVDKDISATLKELQLSPLKSLPPLHVLFPGQPISSQELGDRRVTSRPALSKLIKGLHLSENDNHCGSSLTGKQNKKKSRSKIGKTDPKQKEKSKFTSKNMFDLLKYESGDS